MRFLLSVCAVFVFALGANVVYAQYEPQKFGKSAGELLNMTECPFEKDADAMYAYRTADISYGYDNETGWYYNMRVRERIKVFNQDGLDILNFSIYTYKKPKNPNREDVNDLRVMTISNETGSTKKTKLSKKDIFEEDISPSVSRIKFTPSNARAGVVVDVDYILRSDFAFDLRDWYFQTEYPVGYSSFHIALPEYFRFNYQLNKNYLEFKSGQGNRLETFRFIARESGYRSQTVEIPSNSSLVKISSSEIPSIQTEEYTNNLEDEMANVSIQLMSIHIDGQPVKEIASSYEAFNSYLLDEDDFGKVITNTKDFSDFKNMSDPKTGYAKAAAVYDAFREATVWNEKRGMYSSISAQKILNNTPGDAGDINLHQVAALRAAGFQSNPVVLSTRGNGRLHDLYPNRNDFDYVIAATKIDDKIVLSDATSELPFGMLPARVLNGNGWIIKEGKGEWIDLKSTSLFKSATLSKVTIEGEEIITTIEHTAAGLDCIDIMKTYRSKKEEGLLKELQKEIPDWDISDLNVNYNETPGQERVTLTFEARQEIDDSEVIYIDPIIYGSIYKNYFTAETRTTPIDFLAPRLSKVVTQIQIPDGYIMEKLESPAVMLKLEDKGGKFTYSAKESNNTIQVLSDLRLSQTVFSKQQYPYLRRYWQKAMELNNQLIVLKKQ